MADNSTMGGSTDVLRTEDRAGVKTQIVALDVNPSGSEVLMGAGNPIPVSLGAAGTTPALATVNTSGTVNTNTVLLAANSAREALLVWNAGTGVLSLGFGVTTTTTLYSVRIQPGEGYEVPAQFAPYALNGMSTVATQPVNITSVT